MRSKSRIKEETFDDVGDLLERMALDEQSIRKTLRGAKRGSALHIHMVSGLMSRLPMTYVPEAITILCAVLDVPAFPPEQPPPSLLKSTRNLAYSSLTGLAAIPGTLLSEEQSPPHRILKRNWPAIWNWMQYFFLEFTTAIAPSFSAEESSRIFIILVPSIISNISYDEFQRLTIKDDNLLNLLVKVWLNSDDDSLSTRSDAGHPFRCCNLLFNGLSFLLRNDKIVGGTRSIQAVEMILREAKGDARLVTKRLLRQLRNPAVKCKEYHSLFAITLHILGVSLDDRLSRDTREKFVDALLKDDLVPLLARLLSFIAEELTSARHVLPGHASSIMIDLGLLILVYCISSRNAPHWIATLFKLDFLRTVARILPFVQRLGCKDTRALERMFCVKFPLSLCHRFVVAAAVKAIKEITISGDVAKLETGVVREFWGVFTNVLLERTVLYTVYERDFAATDIKMCENCKKKKQETALFKCSGCKLAFYCSRECQKTAWKTGGHRQACKETRATSYSYKKTAALPTPTDRFLDLVGLAELRRHMPGLSSSRLLANADDEPSPRVEDAFFTVMFVDHPPTIRIRSAADLAAADGVSAKNDLNDLPRLLFRRFQELNNSGRGGVVGNGLPAAFETLSNPVGLSHTSSMHPIPLNTQLLAVAAAGEEFAGDAELPAYLMRKPAKDENGNNLVFALDEVDRFVMDARAQFRPPAVGDEDSPKTIYDYIEAKVAADHNAITWVRWE